MNVIVTANEGKYNGYEMRGADERLLFAHEDAEGAAKHLRRLPTDRWSYSSSCDFASEYGFEQNDARAPLERAYRRLRFPEMLADAQKMMDAGCEPRSALKQAGSDFGIASGDEMLEFVTWAEEQMYGRG